MVEETEEISASECLSDHRMYTTEQFDQIQNLYHV